MRFCRKYGKPYMVASVRARCVHAYGFAFKTRLFSTCGLSIAGGMTHNLMQICVASVVVSSGVFVYLPYMMLAGALAGLVTGILCYFIVGALKGRLNIDFKDCEYHRQIDDENDEED